MENNAEEENQNVEQQEEDGIEVMENNAEEENQNVEQQQEDGTEAMENNAEEENQNVEQQEQERNEVDLPEDPRLKLLKKEWLEGLDCLHIGCNDGTLTIQIAKEFRCWSIRGIDHLQSRITEAELNLSRTVEPISVEAYLELGTSSSSDVSSGFFADSDDETPMELIGELPENPELIGEIPENPEQNVGPFERNPSDIISFRIEIIYRNEIRLMINKYDMILCLSTTHWTELNLEARHLVTIFRRLWYNLQPKGRLVLEPKSLKPYGSNFYDSEAETRDMGLDPNETITRKDLGVKILPEEFWRKLVDVEPEYRKVYQIISNGECIVVFKK